MNHKDPLDLLANVWGRPADVAETRRQLGIPEPEETPVIPNE